MYLVRREISILEIREELANSRLHLERLGIQVSDIDEEQLLFTSRLRSSIDGDEFELEFKFDNYPAWPPFLEFIHPTTRERGTLSAYPGSSDTFFHKDVPCICNPCSRKAYKSVYEKGPHAEWKLIGWRENKDASTITNVGGILSAIQGRINNSAFYVKGRLRK